MGGHILHVVESFSAGTYRMVCAMANRQAVDGFRVSLAYSLREETPREWREQLEQRVNTHHLPMRREIAPVADLQSLFALRRLVSNLQPQIVHLHSSKAGALGRVLSVRAQGARWFFSPHGLSFLQSSTPGHVHPVYLAIERVLAHTPTTILACSPSEAALVRHYLHRRALIVPNGISMGVARTRSSPTRARRGIVAGTAGRISLARGPAFFARVARRLASEGMRFVWLGGGDAKSERELTRAGVEVTGWLPHSRLLDALSNLDIYLQSSLWEGLPVAVMEAMAMGLPVVATDIVGNRDLVQHGRTGWLASSEDEFVTGVERLAADPALRLNCGDAAREYVLERHSTENMMKKLYEAYEL